jgi:hypothetical protein
MSLQFYMPESKVDGVLLIPEMPSKHLFYCPGAMNSILFNDANLFKKYVFLSFNFKYGPFLAN